MWGMLANIKFRISSSQVLTKQRVQNHHFYEYETCRLMFDNTVLRRMFGMNGRK